MNYLRDIIIDSYPSNARLMESSESDGKNAQLLDLGELDSRESDDVLDVSESSPAKKRSVVEAPPSSLVSKLVQAPVHSEGRLKENAGAGVTTTLFLGNQLQSNKEDVSDVPVNREMKTHTMDELHMQSERGHKQINHNQSKNHIQQSVTSSDNLESFEFSPIDLSKDNDITSSQSAPSISMSEQLLNDLSLKLAQRRSTRHFSASKKAFPQSNGADVLLSSWHGSDSCRLNEIIVDKTRANRRLSITCHEIIKQKLDHDGRDSLKLQRSAIESTSIDYLARSKMRLHSSMDVIGERNVGNPEKSRENNEDEVSLLPKFSNAHVSQSLEKVDNPNFNMISPYEAIQEKKVHALSSVPVNSLKIKPEDNIAIDQTVMYSSLKKDLNHTLLSREVILDQSDPASIFFTDQPFSRSDSKKQHFKKENESASLDREGKLLSHAKVKNSTEIDNIFPSKATYRIVAVNSSPDFSSPVEKSFSPVTIDNLTVEIQDPKDINTKNALSGGSQKISKISSSMVSRFYLKSV